MSEEQLPASNQPLVSPEGQARIEQLTAETALRKAQAEAELVEVQLEQAKRTNEAAAREARALHARYSFVPTPRLTLQAVSAGIVLVLVFFTLYQPLVDRVRLKAGFEAETAKLQADLQKAKNETLEYELGTQVTELQEKQQQLKLQAKIQKEQNEKIKYDLDTQVTELQEKQQQLKLQVKIQKEQNEKIKYGLDIKVSELQEKQQQLNAENNQYVTRLKKLAKDFKRVQQEKEQAVKDKKSVSQQLKTVSSKLQVLAEQSATDKTQLKQLADQTAMRAKQLEAQVAALETKAQEARLSAEQAQQAVETRPGRVFHDKLESGGEGPKVVIIPSGSFERGSPETEKGRFNIEGPQHTVTISRPFALSIYEITFAEYDAFVQATGHRSARDKKGWGRGKRPVINVSWDDANAYAHWLSDQTDKSYRLPTEAEWEYAARAGSKTAYSFGDVPTQLHEYAWYADNSSGKTHPVGKRKPNAWGLYDMHGNVSEWVQEGYSEYSAKPVTDPQGPTAGKPRMLRGGNWTTSDRDVRSARRFADVPRRRRNYLGFRLARDQASGR